MNSLNSTSDKAYLFYLYEIINGLEVLYRRVGYSSDPRNEVFNLLLSESRDYSELSKKDIIEAQKHWNPQTLSLEGLESNYVCRGWREIQPNELELILAANAIH